jgi:hypothetical protein
VEFQEIWLQTNWKYLWESVLFSIQTWEKRYILFRFNEFVLSENMPQAAVVQDAA